MEASNLPKGAAVSRDWGVTSQEAADGAERTGAAIRLAFIDDEKFCRRCFAGVDSPQHHEKCVITGYAEDGESARMGAEDVRLLRHDVEDLQRQLSAACARRADAWDEGYDKAMSDAHVVLHEQGFLARRYEDNRNPYREPRHE